jgi:hypothetical protein
LEDHTKRFSSQKWPTFASLLLTFELLCEYQDLINLICV